MTDDQRWDTLWAMPALRRGLAQRGITFRNAYVPTSLCCPSRVSLLTGNYAHTTGVWHNQPPLGGFSRFRDRSTVATWLDGAGYQTGLFGKYLNGYRGRYIPPGWDRWVAFAHSADRQDLYHDYTLNIDGRLERFGRDPGAYSTNVLAAEAVRYILKTKGALFVYFAPYAPHRPMTPARGDRKRFSDLPPYRPPSYDEPDVSDKPKWVRSRERLAPSRKARIDGWRRGAHASLLSVDRSVNAILEALEVTGRLHNTLIIYTSDNGALLGEHRYSRKGNAYEESIRVPFVVRYDRLPYRPRIDDSLVLNLDVAPTIAHASGIRAPQTDGRSLLPLIQSPNTPWRRDFLVEHAHMPLFPPSSCGLHSERFSYVRYSTGEEELYDLAADPYQLSNLADSARHRRHLLDLRTRLTTMCQPPPSFPGGSD
ncbi:MAG: sulfatase [Actinomycetota bacterium]|nr:sulfatase [Actinomycetota bacterium]